MLMVPRVSWHGGVRVCPLIERADTCGSGGLRAVHGVGCGGEGLLPQCFCPRMVHSGANVDCGSMPQLCNHHLSSCLHYVMSFFWITASCLRGFYLT